VGLSQVKKGLRKGRVSERHVCSARVLGWFRGACASRPVENVPNHSESGLTSTPRSAACPSLPPTSPTVRRGLLTPGQAPGPPSGLSTPNLVFHHTQCLAFPGPAACLLNQDPPDHGSGRVAATSSRPRSGEGGTRERSPRSQALRDAQVRRVLNQSKSNERWSQESDPRGRMSAWALKPFHRARPKRGRQNQQEEGGTGATPTHPAEKGLWHLSCRSHPRGGPGQQGSHVQRKADIQWAGRGGLQSAPISQVRKLRPIQGAGGTEPGSRPRAHRCPRPPGCISCSWAGPHCSVDGSCLVPPPPQLQPSLSQPFTALALDLLKWDMSKLASFSAPRQRLKPKLLIVPTSQHHPCRGQEQVQEPHPPTSGLKPHPESPGVCPFRSPQGGSSVLQSTHHTPSLAPHRSSAHPSHQHVPLAQPPSPTASHVPSPLARGLLVVQWPRGLCF